MRTRAKAAEGARRANGSIRTEPLIDVSLVADAVLYMASLPLEGKVQFVGPGSSPTGSQRNDILPMTSLTFLQRVGIGLNAW